MELKITDTHPIEFNEKGVPRKMFDISKILSSHNHVRSSMAEALENKLVASKITHALNRTLCFRILYICYYISTHTTKTRPLRYSMVGLLDDVGT